MTDVPTDNDETDGAATEPGGRPRPRRSLTPFADLFGGRARPPKWTNEERNRIIEELFFDDDRWHEFIPRFLKLTVLSASIAAFGLLTDSAAVVIGAMLVAPLMTPILASAAALVSGEIRRLVNSIAVLMVGTLLAIGVGWLLAKAGSGGITSGDLTDQLLARTAPGLLDLGIAIAAGAAAAYILTDRGAGSALPGVAIAVALVPPLATAGIMLEVGSLADVEGALLLFSTNFLAIVLAAATVFALSGFVESHVKQMKKRRVRIGLAVSVALVVAVAVPLGLHTHGAVEDERFVRTVTATVADWDPQASYEPGTDRHVARPGANEFEQPAQLASGMLPVGIDAAAVLVPMTFRVRVTGRDHGAQTAVLVEPRHTSSMSSCDGRRSVGRAVIDDEHVDRRELLVEALEGHPAGFLPRSRLG